MTGLDNQQREILTLRLQGCTIPEISEQVGLTERTIHRKLAAVKERAAALE